MFDSMEYPNTNYFRLSEYLQTRMVYDGFDSSTYTTIQMLTANANFFVLLVEQ